MKLAEIRKKYDQALKNYKEINPQTMSYIVAMMNNHQIDTEIIFPKSTKLSSLLKYPDIFMSSDEYNTLAGLPPKERAFVTAMEQAELCIPEFELRFESMFIDQIQAIKQHPIVLAIGKTNMSEACISIVIG